MGAQINDMGSPNRQMKCGATQDVMGMMGSRKRLEEESEKQTGVEVHEKPLF